MTDRELMQWALDALDGYARNCKCEGGGGTTDAAEALRARLAQPEQEPIVIDHDGTIRLLKNPPQREWQGLTDEEMFSLWVKCPAETEDRFAFARAIEQALKEKNT